MTSCVEFAFGEVPSLVGLEDGAELLGLITGRVLTGMVS